MYYVDYTAYNNGLGQFWGVFAVNDYDGTNDKAEKNIWTMYGSSWDHVIIKYRDKNADKKSKNM